MVDIGGYNNKSISDAHDDNYLALPRTQKVSSSTSRRMGDKEQKSSKFLSFEDFKEYKRRCENPVQLLSPKHHFYGVAL